MKDKTDDGRIRMVMCGADFYIADVKEVGVCVWVCVFVCVQKCVI